MKATKLILIIAFLSFAAIGFTTEEEKPGPPTIRISLEKALDNPRLVCLMHQQLTGGFLGGPFPAKLITARVTTRLVIYEIYGTIDEWKAFFEMKPIVVRDL